LDKSIYTKPSPIYIGVIYRHPNSTVESIECFEEVLLKTLNILTLNNSKVVVFGDINLELKQIRTNNHI